jgi:hypothetical protein
MIEGVRKVGLGRGAGAERSAGRDLLFYYSIRN